MQESAHNSEEHLPSEIVNINVPLKSPYSESRICSLQGRVSNYVTAYGLFVVKGLVVCTIKLVWS